jgi:DNA-binding XRE family transcriptional regulator
MIRRMIDPQKFRNLRASKGMTTRALAKEAGVSTETINAIEHGRRQPQVRTLDKIAKALGVEVRDFF